MIVVDGALKRDGLLPEPAATPATLTQSADRVYFIERFYSLVAGASEDRICVTLREDLQTNALHAAYTVEAWLEEIQGREEKYDRLATLARSVSPISDLLRALSKGAYTDFFGELIKSYEQKHLKNILAQRHELRQSAGEADPADLPPSVDDDPLSALLAIVATPDGRDDYVAWFQIGWLYWKRGILDEAENAFRTGASFSQRQSPWYFAQSLRHEAFMQWKRGNSERSRSTIRRAIEVRRDPTMLVEAARYSIACGQSLESQSLLDEALHVDPFVFVSVLADFAFASSVTSTVDILVRQQARATELARTERMFWQDTNELIKLAEQHADLPLLPENADDIFANASLAAELDFPTAIFRAEQAKTIRGDWASHSTKVIDSEVEQRTRVLELAEHTLTVGEDASRSKIDKVDSEQRIAELVIQDEHQAVALPIIPPLKDEMMNGLMIGVGIVVAGVVAIFALSQWIFHSFPPLVPVPTLYMALLSPLLFVMLVFGVFGFATIPYIRIRKATNIYNEAASVAEYEADQKLRKVANDSARERENLRLEWKTEKEELTRAVDEAQKLLRAALSAQTTLKRLLHLQK